jgi:hypothetical protein
VRSRSDSALQSTTVKANGRTVTSKHSRAQLTVRLRHRKTTITVTVRLKDARSGTQTITYTRCH